MTYVNERVPRDVETSIRVTGNPLMLSMVVSIFETRVVQLRKMGTMHRFHVYSPVPHKTGKYTRT